MKLISKNIHTYKYIFRTEIKSLWTRINLEYTPFHRSLLLKQSGEYLMTIMFSDTQLNYQRLKIITSFSISVADFLANKHVHCQAICAVCMLS